MVSPKDVLICIPSIDGKVGVHLASFLNKMGKEGMDAILVSGVYPRDYARNMLTRHFLDGKWEWLWWIDADMRPVEGSANLLKWTEQGDILTGYTNAIQLKPNEVKLFIPVMACEKDGAWLTVSGAQKETCYVEGVGFGNTMIHRKVLEDQRTWADLEREMIFKDTTGPKGEVMETEDLVFSRKAREAGYKLVYVPNSPMGHEKVLDVVEVNYWINYGRGKGEQ